MTVFELISFFSCMFSFSAAVTALFAFLKKRRPAFFHVLCILCAFFLISVNSFFAHIHGVISSPILLLAFGCTVSFVFSVGVLGSSFDYIGIAEKSRLRAIPWVYALFVTAALFVVFFSFGTETFGTVVNAGGIWIPSVAAICLAFPALLKGKGRTHELFFLQRRLVILIALLNLLCAAVSWWSPFVFISALSLSALVLFWQYFFGNAVTAESDEVCDRFATDFSLTPREREILNALVKGKTNRELSEQFFVSEKTIETHIAHLYKKIGVKNRL